MKSSNLKKLDQIILALKRIYADNLPANQVESVIARLDEIKQEEQKEKML